MTIEEHFATDPAHEKPVFEVVIEHVSSPGPDHADVVSVGIFLNHPHEFAELRPKQQWVTISFSLQRRAAPPTIRKRPILEVWGTLGRVRRRAPVTT